MHICLVYFFRLVCFLNLAIIKSQQFCKLKLFSLAIKLDLRSLVTLDTSTF